MAKTRPEFRGSDWERHCAELAVDHIKVQTGRDIWAELGGCPRSWSQAAALYRRIGVRSLTEAVSFTLGPPIDRRLAMRGDVAMVDGALGIVRGELVQCLDRMQPIGRATLAWRVRQPD